MERDAVKKLTEDALCYAKHYTAIMEELFFARFGFLYVDYNPDCLALASEPDFVRDVEACVEEFMRDAKGRRGRKNVGLDSEG